MISLGGQAPRVLRTHVGRTCGEPNEIELSPIGVELNVPRHVPVPFVVHHRLLHDDRRVVGHGPAVGARGGAVLGRGLGLLLVRGGLGEAGQFI